MLLLLLAIINNNKCSPYNPDTAAVYKNEALISEALSHICPQYNLKAEDVFITSKLGAQCLRSDHNNLIVHPKTFCYSSWQSGLPQSSFCFQAVSPGTGTRDARPVLNSLARDTGTKAGGPKECSTPTGQLESFGRALQERSVSSCNDNLMQYWFLQPDYYWITKEGLKP